jgi:hypothetical protein
MNIREYWQGVRAIADSLPETVMVTSLRNPERGTTEGRISECDRETAAQLIFAKTHRRATDAEIQAYRDQQAEIRKQIIEAEYKRKQQFALPEELAALVKLAVGQEQNKKRGQ